MAEASLQSAELRAQSSGTTVAGRYLALIRITAGRWYTWLQILSNSGRLTMPVESVPITILRPGEGDIVNFFGSQIIFKVRSQQTGGAFSLFEMDLPARSGPPKMHTHPTAETFRVLSGAFEFHILRDGKVMYLPAGPGTIVHVPGGEPHLFRNVGDAVGRLEIVLCPGEMEGYFLTLGKHMDAPFEVVASAPPPDVQQFLAVGRQYGVEFFDPA
jgi:mannose-6-phosphate isomerase-like protein (cupin superfamily)